MPPHTIHPDGSVTSDLNVDAVLMDLDEHFEGVAADMALLEASYFADTFLRQDVGTGKWGFRLQVRHVDEDTGDVEIEEIEHPIQTVGNKRQEVRERHAARLAALTEEERNALRRTNGLPEKLIPAG